VINDDYFGAFHAVNHLISQGCKRIFHYAATDLLTIGKNRKNGYIQAMTENGLEVTEDMVIQCDTYDEAINITQDLLKREILPDGIFAVNDLTAAGALTVIKDAGMKVPGDIAIIGFTNGQLSRLTDPTLSSVEQRGFEMGSEAAKMLIDRLTREENDYPAKTKILKTELDIKASSQRNV
jgi:LacI family transcriptional regulator